MRMYDLIEKKKRGHALDKAEICWMIQSYTAGQIPDYQMAAFLMAVCFQGMDLQETTEMTLAMAHSGQMADLSDIAGVKVDKHSTGGVGDKTTLIAAPMAAACGIPIAKMSGRGLGFTGGTVDKLESIPGYRTVLPREEFFKIVNEVGISLIGQSGEMAVADKKIYALRDVTATVDSLPLIASSIMSKKIAAGADAILLDVKTGSGAFMKTREQSAALARTMVGIGNEQWQTEKIDFFGRYQAFEKAIHAKYPEIKLIGSAGPDITSERYDKAWEFYKKEVPARDNFCYAVDEHYYVKPDWFYAHTDFYDEYPRDVKVFSGEYASHPISGMNLPQANTLGGALAEAAFLTGVERNADVVVLASYAPLFARVGYAQWSPDMIWFDEMKAYGTPSYFVQKLYGENMGTVTLAMDGQEKELRKEQVYANVSLDERTGDLILKVVNHNDCEKTLELDLGSFRAAGTAKNVILTGKGEDAYNCIEHPDSVKLSECESNAADGIVLPANSFVVTRIPTVR